MRLKRSDMTLATGLVCIRCGKEYPLGRYFTACPSCFRPGSTANLKVTYDHQKAREVIRKDRLEGRPRGVWRFSELLPVERKEHMLERGDGGTPLLNASKLAKVVGVKNLYLKDESRNSTWSFKDRLACTGIGKALDFGAKVVVCLSTGNHGAAVSAHASFAGMDSIVFTVPYVPRTMLVLMMMCGAKVVPIELAQDSFGQYPYAIMKRCVDEKGWYPLGTYVSPSANNPYGVEGYKTIGYEICEQLSWKAPDYIFTPTGDGDGITGTWRGVAEFKDLGFIEQTPRMVAVQPTNAAPLTDALRRGLDEVPPIQTRPTLQFSTGVGSGSLQLVRTIKDSLGGTVTAGDEEVMEMQRELGRVEGVFAEQSSVSSIVGAKKFVEEGKLDRDSTIVCVLTSGGLKDIDAPGARLPKVAPIPNDWDAFLSLMKTTYGFEV